MIPTVHVQIVFKVPSISFIGKFREKFSVQFPPCFSERHNLPLSFNTDQGFRPQTSNKSIYRSSQKMFSFARVLDIKIALQSRRSLFIQPSMAWISFEESIIFFCQITVKPMGDYYISQMAPLLVAAFTKKITLSRWSLDGENGLSVL